MAQKYSHDDYTIAWICALPLELQAAIALLDERHKPLAQDDSDTNQYILGRIFHLNVVILCLPSGEYGITNAATAIVHLRRSFLHVREGLMVGIGGGAPIPLANDVRLGDVVVGQPGPGHGGVLQYDFGKLTDGEFVTTKVSNKPPKGFLNTVSKLRAEDEKLRNGIVTIVEDALKKKLVSGAFSRPSPDTDRLFKSTYRHDRKNESCDLCETSELMERGARDHEQPRIHYGLVASANQVMKDSTARDELARDRGVICFEMEASGVVDEIPALIVRGICDYSDSHKAKIWQPYAALVAAAYAKEFLRQLPLPRTIAIKRKPEPTAANAEPCLRELLKSGSNPKIDKERIEHSKDRLIPSLYDWVLQNAAFESWYNGTGQSILRILGDPGKGKTMMMIGIIDELQKRSTGDSSTCVAYFFCQRTDPRLDNATSVLKGLLFSILSQNDNLVHHLSKHFNLSGADLFTGTQAIYIFQTILFDIFSDVDAPELYIFVDALDECNGQLESLLAFIAKSVTNSSKVKWLVTSRNYLNIEETLRANEVQIKISLEHHRSHVTEAVETYVKEKVSFLSKMKGYSQNLQNQVKQTLRDRSGGTFLWVHLACKRLESVRKGEVLSALEDIPPGLEAIYETMLREVERTSDRKLISKILTTSILAQRPLSLLELAIFAEILPDELEDMEDMIASCGSFLVARDETVFFLHQSAKDFLDNRVGSALIAPSGLSSEHFKLFKRSLDVIHSDLKEDICELDLPGYLTKELTEEHRNKVAHFEYACSHWVDHLKQSINLAKQPIWPGTRVLLNIRQKISKLIGLHLVYTLAIAAFPSYRMAIASTNFSGIKLNLVISGGLMGAAGLSSLIIRLQNPLSAPERKYNKAVESFFEKDFLHWIEVLSILNKTSEGILQIRSLRDIVQKNEHPHLFETRDDAERFLLSHRSMFDLAPLQVYSSAIIFSPQKSIIRKYYFDRIPPWVQVDSKVKDDWGPCLQTLPVHMVLGMHDLSFSPDDKLVAASFQRMYYGITHVWDADTGALRQAFEHSEPVRMHAFSPDSQSLAICDYSHDITILDLKTGKEQKLEHIPDTVGVAYTPESHLVTAQSSGKELSIINRTTGDEKTFDCANDIDWIKFSTSGRLIAAAYDDGTIDITDISTGKYIVLKSPGKISEMKFAGQDGKVVSRSEDGTVCVWDLDTAFMEYRQKNSYNGPTLLSSTGDLMFLAEHHDLTVQPLTIFKLKKRMRFPGHVGLITKMAISSDDRLLVTFADDETLRFWGVAGLKVDTSLKSHSARILDVTLSPDCSLIASCAYDSTIRLWDAHTNAHKKTIATDWTSFVLKFSRDSLSLASGGTDGRHFGVNVWNSKTGQLRRTFEFEEQPTDFTLDFSPNNRLLAYSTCKDVRVYDIATGTQVHHLKASGDSLWGRTDSVAEALSFSHSGRHLAGGSSLSAVYIWDLAAGGTLLHKLESGFAFSFNYKLKLGFSTGDRFLLACYDDKLCLVDTATGVTREFKNREKARFFEVDFGFDNVLCHLKAQTGDSALDSYIEPKALVHNMKYQMLDLDKNSSWIRIGFRPRLYIPLSFRVDIGACLVKDVLVVKSGSGRILTLRFPQERV